MPSLLDGNLAWGGAAESLAQTIRHGIRVPGKLQSRAGIMPAFKTNAAELSDDDVRDLVEYIFSLRGDASDRSAASRGKENFVWCTDCHGKAGQGIAAVGGPSLLRSRFQYGASRSAMFQSISMGRAGVCPSFDGKLDENSIQGKSNGGGIPVNLSTSGNVRLTYR